MTGPSLRKRDGHTSIHDAALEEAKEIKTIFENCLKNNEREKAVKVIDVFIEHWETRTLAHAKSEEEGLYPQLLKQKPELKDRILQLKRDHDLMRRILQNLKARQMHTQVDANIGALMEALIAIDEIHNEEEMLVLPS